MSRPHGHRVAGRQEAALEDQGALVLAPVEAGVVDADRGAGGEFGGQCAVPLAEGLAALRTGELHEPDHRVVGDHRDGEGGLDEAPVVAGHVLDVAGAQGDGARRVEREAVHGAELGRAVVRGGVGQGVRHGAGQGDAAQFGGAADGFLTERVPAAGRCVVAGEQPLVEVDGGEVAEAGHGDVEEFAGGGLQVEGVADTGTGLVEQGEVATGAGGLAGGDVPAGDIGGQSGDADGAAGAAVHAVEVHGPVAAAGFAGRGADDPEIGDGCSGLQYALDGGGEPVGLGAGEIVLDRAAAVVLGPAAEDGGEALVGADHREVRTEQHEAERRLAEYGL